MLEKAESQVHRAADIDVDFLICFIEIKAIIWTEDLEGALDAGVVDQTVDFGVLFYHEVDEGFDVRN